MESLGNMTAMKKNQRNLFWFQMKKNRDPFDLQHVQIVLILK